MATKSNGILLSEKDINYCFLSMKSNRIGEKDIVFCLTKKTMLRQLRRKEPHLQPEERKEEKEEKGK